MRPESAAFLWDVGGAADRIAAFIDGMDEDGYLRDALRRSAVERQLEIIGEAANRLPQEFKAQLADIEWPKIVGLRHRIVHDYFGIDLKIIWRIINEDLRVFKAQLQ